MTGLEWFDSAGRVVTLTITRPRNGLPLLRSGSERIPPEYLDELLAAGIVSLDSAVEVYTITEAGLIRIRDNQSANEEAKLVGMLSELDEQRAKVQADLDRVRKPKEPRNE